MWGRRMARKPDEEICLFVRDEQTRRLLFNAKALQALGINPVEARQRGYPIEEYLLWPKLRKTSPRLSHHP
jgi:hypothetical protein